MGNKNKSLIAGEFVTISHDINLFDMLFLETVQGRINLRLLKL